MPDRIRLDDEQIHTALEQLPGWTRIGDRLHREYRFGSFVEAWAFMTGAAIQAQAMNHHPDWSNVYSRVEIFLSTHDAGGVTSLDLELAGRYEALAGRLLSVDT